MIKFCGKCGNLLAVERKRKRSFLVCKKGHKQTMKREKIVISEHIGNQRRGIVVMGKDEGIAELPRTKIMCPKCDHMEAHWWMQQTRTADEPPTLFYRCTKCNYSWRNYG